MQCFRILQRRVATNQRSILQNLYVKNMKLKPENEMTKYSIHDTRSLKEKEHDRDSLNAIESTLEELTANYSIEDSEDLFDTECNEIVRKFVLSQGTRDYSFVICPNGFIRMMQGGCPVELLLDIHNSLMSQIPNAID